MTNTHSDERNMVFFGVVVYNFILLHGASLLLGIAKLASWMCVLRVRFTIECVLMYFSVQKLIPLQQTVKRTP
jgi:hypothetical protein